MLILPQSSLAPDLVAKVHERRLARFGLLHGCGAELHRGLPRMEEEQDPQLACGEQARTQSGVHRDKVFKRLGHLAPVDLKVSGMNEMVDPSVLSVTITRARAAASVVSVCLCYFVFVVRKAQVDTT